MEISTLLHWPMEAVAAVVAGILVLVMPRILNYAIAVYLLVVGVLGLAHFWYGHGIQPRAVLALVAGLLILIRPAILNYVVGIYLILIGVMESGLIRM